LVPFGLLTACGGRSEDHGGSAGAGGSSAAQGGSSGSATGGTGGSQTGGDAGNTTGGTGAVGGNDGGSAGVSGPSGSAGDAGTGGGQGCCDLGACCPPQFALVEQCIPNDSCMIVRACGSDFVCSLALPPVCLAPNCDRGDTPITGECPPNQRCYTRNSCDNDTACQETPSGCDYSTTCEDTGCDPETDYNYHYVSTGKCKASDYKCPPNTTMFSNACGCGCRQRDTCPWLYPLNSSAELQAECPYTMPSL
jgi:hypothetical protein